MTYKEAKKVCESFALKHKVIFEDEGECGFGRECVGINSGGTWLGFNPSDTCFKPLKAYYMPDFPVVPNHYHKHDCLAVLGTGETAVIELGEWLEKINTAGTPEVAEFATGATGMQALISGVFEKAIFVPELHGPLPDYYQEG